MAGKGWPRKADVLALVVAGGYDWREDRYCRDGLDVVEDVEPTETPGLAVGATVRPSSQKGEGQSRGESKGAKKPSDPRVEGWKP